MSGDGDELDSADRDAILARRKHFIARTLDGIGSLRGDAAERAGRRTKAAVLALGSLAVACPCLDVGLPDTGEPEEGPTTESSDTGTGDTGETGTGETDTDETGTGDTTGD